MVTPVIVLSALWLLWAVSWVLAAAVGPLGARIFPASASLPWAHVSALLPGIW